MLPPILPAVINHVLAQEPWASAKLAEHADKCVCIDAAVTRICLQIGVDGLLYPAPAEAQPNVTLRLKLADLPWMLQNRERAFANVKIEGDAEFAATLAFLTQNLRWEAEHDLQRLVGEVAARRLVEGGKQVFHTLAESGQKLNENLAEYLLEENPVLVRPQAVEDFAAQVAKLRDDVERLEKRLARAEQAPH